MSVLAPRPFGVRLEHHETGRLGIGERAPRISWRVDDAEPGYRQKAARLEITVAEYAPGSARTSIHEFAGAEQVLVAWPAALLRSRQSVSVRVQVHDGRRWGAWSEPGTAETGLLEPGDCSAVFVGPAWPEEKVPHRRPGRVRRKFTVDGEIATARLHLTGHGLVEAEINGRRVGDEELTPGWTSYQHRLRLSTFDVTDHVVSGENAVGVWLADGWWRGRIGYGGGVSDVYGDDLAALVQLEIVTRDGQHVTVASDETWTAATGPTLVADLYDGERVDLRLHDPAWSTAGYVAPGWSPVRTSPVDVALVAPDGPPVRCVEELLPVTVTELSKGRHLLDFGQNHSGRIRLRVDGPAGATITLRHAEVLQGGELYTRTLREAEALDELILAGGPVEWEPRATIHGYRYVEVSGWPDDLEPGQIVSRVLHSDMTRTGWFSSSSPALNRLHENVVWSTKSNFVDLPTDCPQRDERLGWTGDIQVFAPTAGYLFDSTGLLSSWLRDVALEQQEFGDVPFFVPFLRLGGGVDGDPIPPAAVWGDVAVLTPDVIHTQTGDTAVLRRQYASAVTWIERVADAAGPDRICDKTFQFGDWLDPAAPPEDPAAATTEPGLVATAYFAHSSRRLAEIARLIGETHDAERFAALAEEVASAYSARFVPDGVLSDDTQTAHALTTVFDLWPDATAERSGMARLAELVRESDGRIATGFAGTPLVADALTLGGSLAEAYRLLESRELPSWLWTVDMGATTIWERWDSMLPDGTINPGEMTSFNHYALGAVADWMHRVLAGLAPAEPGYRTIRFAPRPGGTVTSASTRHRTPYGDAAIEWQLIDGVLKARVTVPVGATGIVDLPGRDTVVVTHGTHEFEGAMQ